MAQGGRIKDWWHAKSRRWCPIVSWMNQVAAWLNRFEVLSPLIRTTHNGSVQIALLPDAGILPHPWLVRRYVDDGGDLVYTVTGGRVHDGQTWTDVDGIVETAAPASDLYVWLRVMCYNSMTAPSVAEIQTGTEFPESDYEADVLPDADVMTRPTSGWCETIIPIGIMPADDAIEQYLFEDQVLPYGLTYSMPRTIAYRYDEATETVQAIQVTETYVRGVLRSMTDPVAVDVVGTTAECAE